MTRLGAPWIDHLLTVEEQRQQLATRDPILQFAFSFCAKEACSKALGKGVADGVGWLDIELLYNELQPFLRLRNGALQALETMTPEHSTARLDVALSCDASFVQAFVMVSAMSA